MCYKRREAMVVWQHYESLTLTLAQELCEQLRMVLAPTLAAKFKYVTQLSSNYASSVVVVDE